jgi:XisI protein
MDTLNQYRQIVQDILSEYSSRRSTATIDSQCNFDLLRDHNYFSDLSRVRTDSICRIECK